MKEKSGAQLIQFDTNINARHHKRVQTAGGISEVIEITYGAKNRILIILHIIIQCKLITRFQFPFSSVGHFDRVPAI